jgi:ABC-type multidrug transport system permease subunit
MRFLLSTAEKDLRRHLRDPLALALWVVIPLLIGALITLVMGGLDTAPPTAHLLLAEEDGDLLSRLLARAFGQAGPGQFVHIERVTQEEGRVRIGRGEATALLVIPKGFADDVLRDKPTTLLLVTNPAQTIMPRILEESLEIGVEGAFYLHQVAGPELRDIIRERPEGQRGPTDEEVSRISVAIRQIIDRLQKYLFPPVIQVETELERTGPKISTTQMFLPGILVMTLMFMAEGLSGDVWRERDQGTLRRAVCTPASTVTLLGGKLLAAAAVICGCALVVLLAGMLYLGMPLLRLPLVLAWAVFSGVVFVQFLLVLQMLSSSQRAGTVLASSIIMPLLFMGGSFFPFEVMPDWMAGVGRRTPNGWALSRVKEMLFEPVDPVGVGADFAVLLVLGLALFFLGERRLRRVFVRK